MKRHSAAHVMNPEWLQPGFWLAPVAAWKSMEFKSELCDPKSPHSMVKFKSAEFSRRTSEARDRAVGRGETWARGEVESIALHPPYSGNPPPNDRMKPRRRPFRFHPGSVAERAHKALLDGGEMSERKLSQALDIRVCDLSAPLRTAIDAGVIRRRKLPDGSGGKYLLSAVAMVSA